MKQILNIVLGTLFMLFIACGNSTELTPEEQAKVEELKTISESLDQTSVELNTRTRDAEKAVNALEDLFPKSED